MLVFETEFLRSRPLGTDLKVAEFDSARDERSRQAVLSQLTPVTFASFSHIASKIIFPGHAAILNSHDPLKDLEEECASKCESTRNAFNKVLRVKLIAAYDPTHDLAQTVVITPEEWKRMNKSESEKDLYKAIKNLPRTRMATLKWFENAMKLKEDEVLSKVKGLGIYWRNADGSLLWVAGDDSLVPESAGDVSQPESSSFRSSRAQTGDDGGEGSDPAGLSAAPASACSEWVGAGITEANAGSGELELTEEEKQEMDESWEKFYQG